MTTRSLHGSHAVHGHSPVPWSAAIQATLHCLTGCAIGEGLGMVIGASLGWGPGAAAAPTPVPWPAAIQAPLHCLTGCAIGEVLGMVIGTSLGWSTAATVALAVALALVLGSIGSA